MQRREFLKRSAGALAFAGMGCATPTPASSGSFSWEIWSPRGAGVDPEGLPRVRAAVQTLIDGNQLTGAVTAFARNNKLVWHEAQGVREVESGAPMRRDDLFQMMSSTKVVTAVAVMMMAEQGRLDIDHPVSRYIPSFANPRVAIGPPDWRNAVFNPELRSEIVSRIRVEPASREITIKDLLTHTAGFSCGGPGRFFNEEIEAAWPLDLQSTLAARIPHLGGMVLDFQPGTYWAYSAVDGMDTLLHIVELVSGQDAESFLHQRLFAPLEMNDSYFNVPLEKRSRLLPFYTRVENSWREAPRRVGDTTVSYICGAGGLISTARDYMNFETMLLNGGMFNGRRVLRPETVGLMRSNHTGELLARSMGAAAAGMGFGLGGTVVIDPVLANNGRGRGAFGWRGAFGTESWSDPENNIAAAYFVQQPDTTGAKDFALGISSALV